MEKNEIIEGILYMLQGATSKFDGQGYKYSQILDFLKANGVIVENLREILKEIEDKGLIEERYFGKEHDDRIDYAIEQKGIDLIKNKRKEVRNKWKLQY